MYLLDLTKNYSHSLLTWATWKQYLMIGGKKLIILLVIVVLSWLALKVRKIVIDRIFRITKLDEKQEETLASLLMSLTKYVFFIVAIIEGLINIGLNVSPIIASAGVLGLAFGFGAQTLVKDLITGFFIIFEDQFSVGDFVSINNGQINGTVVDVGLRSTKIRTWAQHVVVIQNSQITVSQNYNRERMRAIVNITVPYEVDPADVEIAVHTVASEIVENEKHMFLLDDQGEPVEAPQLYGITDVENNALGAKYTVTCLVKDAHYFTACKMIRQRMLMELRGMGIQIAYPRRIEHRYPINDMNAPLPLD